MVTLIAAQCDVYTEIAGLWSGLYTELVMRTTIRGNSPIVIVLILPMAIYTPEEYFSGVQFSGIRLAPGRLVHCPLSYCLLRLHRRSTVTFRMPRYFVAIQFPFD